MEVHCERLAHTNQGPRALETPGFGKARIAGRIKPSNQEYGMYCKEPTASVGLTLQAGMLITSQATAWEGKHEINTALDALVGLAHQ